MMLQGIMLSHVVEGCAAPHHVVPRVVRTVLTPDRAIPAHVVPRVIRTALTPDRAIAKLKDTIEWLRLPQ
jgi:hypothetical protein